MVNRIILDSSFLVALHKLNDTNNIASLEIAEQISNFDEVFITNYIYLETSTILSQRLGKKILDVLNKFIIGQNISEIFIDFDLDQKIRYTFAKLISKDISYADVSTAVVAKNKQISGVVTFDKHFIALGKMFGFKVIDPKHPLAE